MVKVIGLKDMKEINKKAILSVLFQNGHVSRSDLAKLTTLGNSTITQLINELVSENLVEEIEVSDTIIGRKPVLLGLKSKTRFEIIVDLKFDQIDVYIHDLNTDSVGTEQRYYPNSIINGSLLNNIVNAIDFSLMKNRVNRKYIIGIALNNLDILSSHHHMVLMDNNVLNDQIPIQNALEMTYGTKVYISNDATAKSIAEEYLNIIKSEKGYIFINVSNEISAVLVNKEQNISQPLYLDSMLEVRSEDTVVIDHFLEVIEQKNEESLSGERRKLVFNTFVAIDRLSKLFNVNDFVISSDEENFCCQGGKYINKLENTGLLNIYIADLKRDKIYEALAKKMVLNYLK